MESVAMASSGVVRSYDAAEGWGVIDGADVPGGCWVHCSAIATAGCRQLSPGEPVSFHVEAADQVGFAFRAVKVWRGDGEPAATPDEGPSPSVYHSRLNLSFDEPNDLDRPCTGSTPPPHP